MSTMAVQSRKSPTTPTTPATPVRRTLPPSGSVLPRTGVVLVGSARAVRGLAALIASLETGSPILAGWIELNGPSEAPDATWSLPRLGTLDELPLLAARLNLTCAVACADSTQAAAIRTAVQTAGLECRFIPSAEELLKPLSNSAATAASAASTIATTTYQAAPAIDLGQLIGRTPYSLDRAAVGKLITGKRVLITGAGGSIGSELARVAASFNPEQLILMERAENALFEIDRTLARKHPAMGRRAVLHDCVDAEGTLRLLAELRPHVVFHSAAHKHVPLMEDHPGHAITNNLFGTKSIADAAVAVGAERFVMISSDKAVNPTSVMGATKRLAEMYVRGLGPRAAERGTQLSMVRFGNVLGSACSVLTIWSTQLGEGGPITITDPRMTRYFMTIPEAATLVVQSMCEGTRGRVGVFVLDMGEPIRILELAARFIRAHGLTPRISAAAAETLSAHDSSAWIAEQFPIAQPGAACIDLEFTGSRPGEKIHEELAYAAEMLGATKHPGVKTWAGPGFGDDEALRAQTMVAELSAARFAQDRGSIIAAIRKHVPEMRGA